MQFAVRSSDDVAIERPAGDAYYYALSPYVWHESGGFHALVRVVNRSERARDKVARVHYARGLNALRFALDERPAVAPGDAGEDDCGGCEDPTLAKVAGRYHVFYSGWNEATHTVQLLSASGSRIDALEKRGRVFTDVGRFVNAKEATIVRCEAQGDWRLYFEYAEDGHSKIGVASAKNVDGPWEFQEPPFDVRRQSWDSWHLSTGPVSVADPQRPVMFYNGADKDARWRIGWVAFDPCFSEVVERCDDPLIAPPRDRRDPEDTDIAFAASLVDGPDEIALYYSIADRWLERALVTLDR